MSSSDTGTGRAGALKVDIEALSSNEKVRLKPALKSLLSAIEVSADASTVEIISSIIDKWLSLRKLSGAIEKINASETTVLQITEVFGLEFDEGKRWTLGGDIMVEVPPILKRILIDLKGTPYDQNSEATSRITVDIILIQCWKHLRDKFKPTETSDAETSDVTNFSTPKRAVVNMPTTGPMNHVKLFPESSLSIEIPNKLVQDGIIQVTGRADWAMGYSNTRDEGTLLIAIEAKQRSEFSKGEAQLIAYLAMLRESRIKAAKTNTVTQGFYTDGSRFGFICITADASIQQSPIYNIKLEGELKIVFNFIIAMIETAMKSTPRATPTKPGEQQEKEVNHYKNEVWLKAYILMNEALNVDPDDDMDVSEI